MPADVHRLVKKLEKHPEIETPWALAIYMRKKGYKMPAKAEEELDERRELRKSFEKQWDKPEPKPEPKKANEGTERWSPFERPVGPIPAAKDKSEFKDYATKIHNKLTKACGEEEKVGEYSVGKRPSSIRKSMSGVPHEKDVVRHLQVIDPKKAEEEDKQLPIKPSYTKMLKSDPKMTSPGGGGIKPKKMIDRMSYQRAEEEDKQLPIKPSYTKMLKSDPKMTSPGGGGIKPKKMIDRMSYQRAEEEKYELPAPKQERDLDSYQKKLREKVGLLQFGEPKKAEEERSLAKDAIKRFRKKLQEGPKKEETKKAEEKLIEALPNTPKEHMEYLNKKPAGPAFIDTKPSGKGKSLEEWASNVVDAFLAEETVPRGISHQRIGVKEKLEDGKDLFPISKQYKKTDGPVFSEKAGEKTPSIKEMHRDYVTSPESVLDSWKPEIIPPSVKQSPFASSDEDMLVYPDEFKKGMKEEMEHRDITGGDKDETRKIVTAHLREDPHYYTKLGTKMKSSDDDEEEVQKGPAGPIDVSKGAPPGFIPRTHKKAEEELNPIGEQYKKTTQSNIMSKPSGPQKKLSTGPSTIRAPSSTKPLPAAASSQYKKPKMQTPGDVFEVHEHADTERDRDYTTWQREKHEEKSKPLLKRITEKLFGEEETTPGSKPLQTMKPSDKIKSRLGDIKSLTRQVERIKSKAEEDQTSDYLKSVTERKSPKVPEKYDPGLITPKHDVLPKHDVKRKSTGWAQEAEEELDMPQKEFDEDALNELYMFMDWMHGKGFKAEDGDAMEKYMDQYDVEKFSKEHAEEAMPPAEFKAPNERK